MLPRVCSADCNDNSSGDGANSCQDLTSASARITSRRSTDERETPPQPTSHPSFALLGPCRWKGRDRSFCPSDKHITDLGFPSGICVNNSFELQTEITPYSLHHYAGGLRLYVVANIGITTKKQPLLSRFWSLFFTQQGSLHCVEAHHKTISTHVCDSIIVVHPIISHLWCPVWFIIWGARRQEMAQPRKGYRTGATTKAMVIIPIGTWASNGTWLRH